ncbi:MAG TPA: 4'-phosphopantetheinyl transferase superfamily protein [Gammaproteobacteria bacterium]|nr:4'-phosphopantetheinyl transferase superfamily protein [Gammaproteobacteria bacterium]
MTHDTHILLSEMDPGRHAARERGLLPRLAAQEQARYRAFGAEVRRRSWLAGRELLCTAVMRAVGEVDAAALLTEDSGGVRYSKGGLHLNLSHSGDWFAAACTTSPVGIDIEQVRPRAVTTQAARVFCVREAAALEKDTDPLTGFYRLWTLKEAACKAAGLTVWDSLQHVCFDLEAGRCHLTPPFPVGDWHFIQGSFAPSWQLALALRGAAPRIGCWRRNGAEWDSVQLSDTAYLTAGEAEPL